MTTSDQSRGHSPFPFSHTTITQEIVAIHDCKLMQEEFECTLIPAILWTLALKKKKCSNGIDIQEKYRSLKLHIEALEFFLVF